MYHNQKLFALIMGISSILPPSLLIDSPTKVCSAKMHGLLFARAIHGLENIFNEMSMDFYLSLVSIEYGVTMDPADLLGLLDLRLSSKPTPPDIYRLSFYAWALTFCWDIAVMTDLKWK